MNKWYFTKNNTITEPMDFEAAKKFVAANLDSYGWQQSFTQWLPVHCINDFAGIVPEAKPLPLVPQGVVDEFNSKSKKIIDNISKVNSDISSGEKLLQVFAQEIDTYKKMTVKLSPEVQANINSIEEHYFALQKQLQDIKQTTNTTANEVSQVVSNFNLKITDKSVASITSELQKNIAKQINKSDVKPQPVIEDEIDKAIREKLKISPPDLSKKPSDETTPVESNKTADSESKPVESKAEVSAESKSSESSNQKASDEKIVNIRPPRPAGAKVISTRSNRPGPGAGAHYVNNNTATESKDTENSASKETTTATAATSKDAKSSPSKVKIIAGIPVIDHAETAQETKTTAAKSKQNSAESDADKIKDKIGAGVKNIFSSMFNSEPTSPPMSSAIKDIVNNDDDKAVTTEQPQKVEKVEEIKEIESYEEPMRQKRRRRR